jgi:SAM-dependent methyltransferase
MTSLPNSHGWREKNFWFRARNRLIQWALRRYFPEARNFLDVGCGTGFVLSGVAAALPWINLFGREICSAGLEHAARRIARFELFQMDARAIPFRDKFDVIGAFDVLEHIHEDKRFCVRCFVPFAPVEAYLLPFPSMLFCGVRPMHMPAMCAVTQRGI